MGQRSGGGVVVVVAPSCGGGGNGWTEEVEALLGGGGGHTVDPVIGDPPPSGSLAPDLGARVPVGLPCDPTWIRVMCLGVGLSDESSIGKILMVSSSSSVFPSPPSPCPGDENLKCLDATR
jgi:hypothetical protein